MPNRKPRKPADTRLRETLQEMGPSWSGVTPEAPKPIRLSREDQVHPEPMNEGRLALSAFHKICAVLDLTMKERAQMLGVSRSTLRRWKARACKDPDKLDRMALFVRIFDLAAQAFPGPHGGQGWLRRPNEAQIFGGKTPLSMIMNGRNEKLIRVCDYLTVALRTW